MMLRRAGSFVTSQPPVHDLGRSPDLMSEEEQDRIAA
jgi:hypothetical protein